ncbi:Aubergine/Piwi-like protein copy E [Daphnia pulex]|uniref:Aubergine/Piwi-like protein copy E n=1 Tax=Daphnia pulex TaxID=6669 RepID=E9GBD4_DAPPU|nr:Aubergine/Piwi-like protein copy E [Daphnia pulex]|eukprot:EFX83177.1 Aubergine/Piwi-like protein copy E [Daphnia pulex]
MSDAERRGVKRSSRELQQHLPRRPQENARAHNGTSSQIIQEIRQGEVRGGEASGESGENAGSSRGLSRIRNNQPLGNTTEKFFHQILSHDLVTRPTDARFSKAGSEGSQIEVQSNYFHLTKRPDMKLLQYRVDFTPEIDHPGVKKALIRVHEQMIGKYIFDGTLLYNTTRLPQPLELISKRKSDDSEVKITLRLTSEIQKEDPVYTSVTNLILRRCMSMLNLVMIRRNFYDKEAREDVPNHPITIWPGYLTTIRHHEQEYFMNVEVINKFLRRDTAYDVMDKMRLANTDNLQERIKAELVGKIVMTGYNNKTYRIDDVDFVNRADSTFHLKKEDRDISYIEYYKNRYQQNIRFPNQPMLVSRPSRRDINGCANQNMEPQAIYLVPELCGMTGLSAEQRDNNNLKKAISNITRVTPDKRVETLLKFRRRLANSPEIQRELTSWGLQFANDLVTCKARILPAKPLMTGAGRISIRDGEWSSDMQRNKMAVSAEFKEWIVILPSRMNQQVRHFVKLLQQVGLPQGFNVPEPRYVALEREQTSEYINAMRDNVSHRDYDIVMCVLRTNRTDTYSAIKKYTFCERGIPSQVITGRIIEGNQGKLMSVATKVMTQIACKLGAEPWKAQVPNKPWMIVGYDTFHDAAQRKAVGAFVASTNDSFTRYNSSVKIHSANEEISPSFQDHMLTSLKAYYMAQLENKSKILLPENIIVYRDGIGAGDIQTVLDIELEGIKEACKKAAMITKTGHYNPGISFVIVSKKINTRFFLKRRDAFGNPPCGTVVDNTVTLSERFDFFLVSQKVNQGTISPINFNVIYNSSNITPDIHQSLAYALTHVYFNWPGTVRVPAPIQYAHKLAYLIGERTQRMPLDNLAKYPYYL